MFHAIDGWGKRARISTLWAKAAPALHQRVGSGLKLLVDLDVIDEQTTERAGRRLREFIEALDARHKPA